MEGCDVHSKEVIIKAYPECEDDLRKLKSMETLRLVWVKDYHGWHDIPSISFIKNLHLDCEIPVCALPNVVATISGLPLLEMLGVRIDNRDASDRFGPCIRDHPTLRNIIINGTDMLPQFFKHISMNKRIRSVHISHYHTLQLDIFTGVESLHISVPADDKCDALLSLIKSSKKLRHLIFDHINETALDKVVKSRGSLQTITVHCLCYQGSIFHRRDVLESCWRIMSSSDDISIDIGKSDREMYVMRGAENRKIRLALQSANLGRQYVRVSPPDMTISCDQETRSV